MPLPRVSVILPVYNAAPFLREAIDSILDQTFRDFELIVIDDGSTDESAAIVQSYRDERLIRITNEKNLGVITARNQGLDIARGALIGLQDADDISDLRRLELEVAYLDQHPEIGLVGSACTFINAAGRKTGLYTPPLTHAGIRCLLLFSSPFANDAVLWRAELTRELGLRYVADAPRAEDFEMWPRMLQHTRGANLPERLLHIRKHGNNASIKYRDTQNETANAVCYRQHQALLPGMILSKKEIAILRRYYEGLPPNSDLPVLRVGCIYLDLFHALEHEMHEGDVKEIAALRRAWAHNTYQHLYGCLLGNFLLSGLAWKMLRAAPGGFFAHLVLRCKRRFRSILFPKTTDNASQPVLREVFPALFVFTQDFFDSLTPPPP